jgi:hypothetical protein
MLSLLEPLQCENNNFKLHFFQKKKKNFKLQLIQIKVGAFVLRTKKVTKDFN